MVTIGIRGGQGITEGSEAIDNVGVIDRAIFILPEIRIRFSLKGKHTGQVDTLRCGSILDQIKGKLIDSILGNILQKQAVGDIRKGDHRTSGILNGKRNGFAYRRIIRIGINQLIITGFQLKGGIFIGLFAFVSQVYCFILHSVGPDLPGAVCHMGNRELHLSTGIFDNGTIAEIALHHDLVAGGIRTGIGKYSNQDAAGCQNHGSSNGNDHP